MLLLLTSILAFGMSCAMYAEWSSMSRKRAGFSWHYGLHRSERVSSALLWALVGGLAATTAVVLLLT